ncbi:unnamed protein product [Durusdinium trenchii]
MEGGTLNPRASTLDFTVDGQRLLPENATTVAQGEGRLMLTKVPGTLYGLLLPPTGASRFSALTRDADFAPLGFALVSIFGRRVAGPIEVGYLATSDTGGLSSPSAVAYAALPEPCLYVVDTGNHRLLQLEVQGLRYRTHFGESGFAGSDLARLSSPRAVAVGDGYRVYVLDTGNGRLLVLATGDTLGHLTALQSLSLPFAATALTLLPGAGLGVARLWAGGRGARRLARWDLTPPGFWAVSGTSTAQAVAPLYLDVRLSDLQLDLGAAGGLLLTAAPLLAWQLPPGPTSTPAETPETTGVPPLCEATVATRSGARSPRRIDCEFRGAGPGLPSPSVFLKVDHLDSTEESRISLRCATPQGGAAPNLFDVSGWWSLALVVQGGVGRSVRSRLLPVWPQRDGALPVAVTPQLARPLVLVPVGGEVQLGLDLTVRAVLTLGALLVGSSRLPGHVALQLPEGLQLLSADGCSATGCCSCHVPLDASAVRLQADGLYPLTLQLRAPHAPVPTTWRLELHSAGPWQVSGVTESVGVKFTFGRLIPSTWSHFPVLHATPPILGDTLLVVTFRPYTSGAGHVVLVGPETAVLRCRRLALRALSEAPGPPSEWRCWAPRERYVEITVLPEEFSPAVTYRLELEVQHLPGSWVPDEEDQASLFGNASEATPWWRLSFEDVNHTRLATARWIPGYPLWPETFDLALDYLNLPLSLSPGAKSTLAVTISSFQALGLPVYVRLYAPEQVSLLCREGAVVLWPSRFTAAPTAHATCRGIGTLELVIWEALAPDTNYSFQATVTLPNSTNLSIDWWYVTLEAAGVRLGASAPQRPIVVPEAIQAEEDSDVVTTSSAADEDAPAADATEAADATVSELRVERLVVHEAENETTLGPWLLQQTWAETHELLALEILQIQVDGVPLGAVLSAGGSLKLHAPPGFTFPSPFDAASVRALGLAPTRSRVEGNGTATVLHFQDDVESVAMDVSVAVRWAPPEEEAVEPWRLELWSASGKLLAAQGNIGSFDRTVPFRRLWVTSDVHVPGASFEVAVFFAMPAVEGARSLRLEAPPLLSFACAATAATTPAVASGVAGSLQDDVITAAAARPLPPGSCVASQNVLTLHLLSALQPAAVYGFPALARHGATREAPEVTAERVWFGALASSAAAGSRRISSSASMVRLKARELTPVWLHCPRPYYGQESLLFVIFAVGSQAFPSSKLRLSWQTPSSSPSHRFMSCFWQQSLLRRQQWRSPWDLTQVPAVLEEEGTTASTADSLLLASFEGCTGGEEQVTLSLEAPLAPLKSYLLQLAVAHGPEAENATEAETLLTLEVLEDSQGLPRALARSADLRTYALAEEMTLTRWSYSSAFRSAENSLDLEFQPSKTTSESQATMLGFLLQAPPTFLFTQKSCEELVLQRSERVENLQLGRVESKALFLQGMPLCEVLPSPWLFEGGYYQHQLTVYLPPLVGFRQDFRYRVKVSVLNPPLPLDDPVMKRFLREKTSPKFSRSSYLAPALQTWRLSTFLWFSGDRGTGEVPYSLNQKGPLGRPGGLRKLEEVAWKGFEILT